MTQTMMLYYKKHYIALLTNTHGNSTSDTYEHVLSTTIFYHRRRNILDGLAMYPSLQYFFAFLLELLIVGGLKPIMVTDGGGL